MTSTGEKMIKDFSRHLEKLKKRYNECESEREKKTLFKKIKDHEEFIQSMERFS